MPSPARGAILPFVASGKEQALFTGLAWTVLTGAGPKLVHHDKANCVELTGGLLDRVVERVVGWYDAVEGVLIA